MFDNRGSESPNAEPSCLLRQIEFSYTTSGSGWQTLFDMNFPKTGENYPSLQLFIIPILRYPHQGRDSKRYRRHPAGRFSVHRLHRFPQIINQYTIYNLQFTISSANLNRIVIPTGAMRRATEHRAAEGPVDSPAGGDSNFFHSIVSPLQGR